MLWSISYPVRDRCVRDRRYRNADVFKMWVEGRGANLHFTSPPPVYIQTLRSTSVNLRDRETEDLPEMDTTCTKNGWVLYKERRLGSGSRVAGVDVLARVSGGDVARAMIGTQQSP